MHPRFQQTKLRTYCDERELAVIAYASLGCGDLLRHKVVVKVAQSHGKTAAQVGAPPCHSPLQGLLSSRLARLPAIQFLPFDLTFWDSYLVFCLSTDHMPTLLT